MIYRAVCIRRPCSYVIPFIFGTDDGRFEVFASLLNLRSNHAGGNEVCKKPCPVFFLYGLLFNSKDYFALTVSQAPTLNFGDPPINGFLDVSDDFRPKTIIKKKFWT